MGIFLLIWILDSVLMMLRLTEQEVLDRFMSVYFMNNLSFKYYRNVLLPQIGIGLLAFSAYVIVTRLLIPFLTRIDLKGRTSSIIWRLFLWMGMVFMCSWLLALGANLITWYAHPWLFNYGYFQLLGLFGYNDHPLQHGFFGWWNATKLVVNYTAFFGLVHLLIRYFDRPGPKRAYRVLIVNQCTMFALIYFSVMVLVGVLTGWTNSLRFIGNWFVPAIFALFMVNTYRIFPRNQSGSFWEKSMLVQLLLYSVVCTFPLFMIAGFGVSSMANVGFFVCLGVQWLITTPVSWQLFRQRKDRILQLRGVEQALVQTKADLQLLRSQINPHFLFNALNTLYGTALRENAPDAAAGIQKLGDMMRFMLHDNHLDAIPLDREVEYLRNYIDLQKLRIQTQPDIQIVHDIQTERCPLSIAPMLLIPFVENAFKHGISLRRPSWIQIQLACEEGVIHFTVRNSVHPHQAGDPEQQQSGIGLQNVRERLQLVYPEKHALQITDNGREFAINLTIQA